MSLKNFIFTNINKEASSSQQRLDDAVVHRVTRRLTTRRLPSLHELDEYGQPKPEPNWLKKTWKFISVEPVMICWLLPTCLLYIAIENLALEKVILFFYFHYTKP